jgi:hypothetical protein
MPAQSTRLARPYVPEVVNCSYPFPCYARMRRYSGEAMTKKMMQIILGDAGKRKKAKSVHGLT